MAKKRGKSKANHISKNQTKKPKAASNKKALHRQKFPKEHLQASLRDLELLAKEKKMEHKIEEVEQKESQIEIEEKKIEKEIAQKPLTTFNFRDLNKGIVGAFIGVVAHFGFVYGSVLADKITTARAGLLLVFSYMLIVVLMYETGYRDIKEKRLLGILPKRATFIFITSIIVVAAIFFLFNMVDLKDPVGFFKQIAVTSVLASLGAGTADLLGKH